MNAISSKKNNNHFNKINTISSKKKNILKRQSYLSQGYHGKNKPPKDNSTYMKNSTFFEKESIIQNKHRY